MSDDVKYYNNVKYEKKVLVWIAISPKGMTPAFIIPSGQELGVIKAGVKTYLQRKMFSKNTTSIY